MTCSAALSGSEDPSIQCRDRPSTPSRVWNRIAPEVQDQIVDMALEHSELSPRELAVRFTDEKR